MAQSANDRQVGGNHYKVGGEEHWDRAWRLQYDPFQYIITKWVERWRKKGGIEDLKKARHAIDKYIELVEAGGNSTPTEGAATGRGYVDQDRRSQEISGGPLDPFTPVRTYSQGKILD